MAERNTILVGDFNMPGTDWENWKINAKGKALMEAAQEEGMAQLVNFPTHTKGNILDILLTNCPEKIANVSNIGRIGKSDHVGILIEEEREGSMKIEKQVGLNWRRANFDEMKKEITEVDWDKELRWKDIEEAWVLFREKVEKTVNDNVPRYVNTRKRRPEWSTQEIVREIRKKRFWKRLTQYGGAEMDRKYNKQEKYVTKIIRNAKRRMEKKLANDREDKNQKQNQYWTTEEK
jgi:hypothetical protein